MDILIIRGGGDIATGIAHRLYMAGFKIAILEIGKPSSIRRKVSFSEAIYENEVVVEGVKAVRVNSIKDIYTEIDKGNIPVYVDENGTSIQKLKPIVLIDSILAKKNLGTSKKMAKNTIGIGPGFEAGLDVDLVIESMRGHDLGKVIYKGKAEENTGIPGIISGYGEERVIRASGSGYVENLRSIGEIVEKNTPICKIEDKYVYSEIAGVIRGLIKEGLLVHQGMKIGDIDPRGIVENTFTISDKARSIGGGVLEAVMYLLRRDKKC